MEIKVDININLKNINQIINQLSQLIPSRLEPAEKIEINEKTTERKIDIIQLREKLVDFGNENGAQQVQVLLQKYNAKKVTEMKPEDYEKLYNEITNNVN